MKWEIHPSIAKPEQNMLYGLPENGDDVRALNRISALHIIRLGYNASEQNPYAPLVVPVIQIDPNNTKIKSQLEQAVERLKNEQTHHAICEFDIKPDTSIEVLFPEQ